MATYPQTTNGGVMDITFICPHCGDKIRHEPWPVACQCGYLQTDRGQLHFMLVSEP